MLWYVGLQKFTAASRGAHDVWTLQVTRVDERGRNSPKHIFIPVTSESLSCTRSQSSAGSVNAGASPARYGQPGDSA